MTERARDHIDGTVDNAQQRGEDAFSDLTGDAQVGDFADVPQNQFGEMAGGAQSQAGDLVGNAQDHVGNVAGNAQSQAESMPGEGGGLDDLLADAKEKLGGLMDKITGGDDKQ